MKNLIIVIVILLGAWKLFDLSNGKVDASSENSSTDFANSSAMQTLEKAKELANPTSNFRCDGREYCSEMKSFEEAEYFLQNCPNTKMDGDNDGVPCESQFGK